MKQDKWSGTRLLVLAGAVLLLAIVVVIRYEDALNKINWALVAILSGFACVTWALYSWQSRPTNTYDVSDLFMTNAKADLWKHMVLLFGAISAWVLVQQALANTLTTEMLSIILGIFVGKEAVGTIAVAIATRPPALAAPSVIAPAAGSVNVQQAP